MKKIKTNNQDYEIMYIDSDRITKTTPNEMNTDNKYDTTKQGTNLMEDMNTEITDVNNNTDNTDTKMNKITISKDNKKKRKNYSGRTRPMK